MIFLRRTAFAAAILAAIAAPVAYGAGMFSTLPGIGGASYCASTVTGVTLPAAQGPFGVSPGSTQGTGVGICGQTVPAGPAVFAGTEVVPFDVQAPGTSATAGGAQTALVNVNQLGQGPVVDNNVAGATQTIPNGTQWFVLDTNTPATVTVTLPAVAVEGQEVHVVCGIAIATTLTISPNTSQTIKAGPAAGACAAGAVFGFRFVAAANGALVANTWLRIQ
jgi:hypothetical protein